MGQDYRAVTSDAGIEIAGFPRLKEQMGRLKAAGDDPAHVDYRHPNALLVAADLLELGTAERVARNAALIVLSGLTTDAGQAQDLDVALRHADGTVARLAVRFGAGADLPAFEGPGPEGKRLWVERASVAGEDVQALVERFAEAGGMAAGGYQSLVGAGAVLALLQAVDSANAKTYQTTLEGFGDDAHRRDAALRLAFDAPAPRKSISP